MKGIELKVKTAYVIIHGLAGSTKEVAHLDKFLNDRGLAAYSIVLKGHEKSNKELAKTTYNDWILSAEKAISALNHDKIVIIGFSMGGLIAANLAQKLDIESIVFVNTPIFYWDVKKIAINVLKDIKSKEYSNIKRYLTASTDKPFITLLQFVMLLNKTKRKLNNLKCDALVLQSKNDDTVNAKSADYIFNSLLGKKQIKYYEGGSHNIFDSEIKDIVCEDIYKYILKI